AARPGTISVHDVVGPVNLVNFRFLLLDDEILLLHLFLEGVDAVQGQISPLLFTVILVHLGDGIGDFSGFLLVVAIARDINRAGIALGAQFDPAFQNSAALGSL